ncbi:membrane protease YdiL (CAAX protease family) [Metabacillus crassostreae]|uniref:CPBP family intramembrane glutamic endopeptidase n=1 Tax=Metabacillus crassostreae TaxID=929098 RepID=UPI00195BBE3E|nr:CPBP family intramembrane glutamic endopeptidase [Metabacillus crassostreae]MBM7603520.1 membrane protease YdiL (CAAX protease family) [Metabacillus crassostreae]
MEPNFIKIVNGKNTHWRYILSLLVILAFMFIIGVICYIISMLITGHVNPDLINLNEMVITDPLVDFYLYHIVNITTVIGMWIAARMILKRKLISFITPYNRVNWSKILYGFLVSFLLFALFSLVDYIISPNDYMLNNFDGSRFVWLVLASILLVPIQTTSEELFFRGFLLQWVGKVTKNPVVLTLIVGGIFGSLHFWNPEMEHGAIWIAIDYLAMGFIWTYITIKTNSSEYSIGAHAANNMFLCIFLTMEDTVVGDIPSLFVLKNVNAMSSAITTVLIGLLFMLIVLRKYKIEKSRF